VNKDKIVSKYVIGKFLSGLLRHFPHKFGIKLDKFGWADLDEVAKVIATKYGIEKDEAMKLIEKTVKQDEKGRFELKNGKIRAKYGHSVKVETRWSDGGEIPKILYHGTSRKAIQSILKEGILPMKRREVHLSSTYSEAFEVGKRYDRYPVVLRVNARKMIENGYEIRKKGKVFTTDYVPPEYIDVEKGN